MGRHTEVYREPAYMVSTKSQKYFSLSTLEFVVFVSFSFFIIPFSIYPSLMDPGMSVRFILLAVLVAVLAGFHFAGSVRFPQEPQTRLPRLLAVACLGYFILCLVSIIPSINKAESIFETAKVFLFCAYVWLASSVLQRFFHRIPIIARLIVISSLCISLLAILEYWDIFQLMDNGWVGPGVTMINRNLVSSYLFLCLGFVLFTIVNYRGIWRVLGILSFEMVVYVYLSTQTRAVWLGCLCGALVTLFIVMVTQTRSLSRFVMKEKGLLLLLAILTLLCALTAIHFKSMHTRPEGRKNLSFVQRAATVADPSFDANQERLHLWRKTCAMIKAHPFSGVGSGNWKILVPKYGTGDLVCDDMAYAEIRPYNDFLWTASETGVFGFVFYCGLFLTCGLFCLKALRGNCSRSQSFLGAALLFTIAGFAVISFLDFPKERIEHLVLFGTVLSAAAALDAQGTGRVWKKTWLFRVVMAAVFLASCGCLWIGFARLKGDVNDMAMRSLWQNREWQKAIDAADRASSVFYSVEFSSMPIAWYRGVANFSLGNQKQAFLDYTRAAAYHPWHLHVINDLGTCYSLQGDRSHAIECFSKALSISPFFEPALINLAAVYFNAGQYDLAYSIIARVKGPHVDPRFESYRKAISLKVNKEAGP
jgi:O-antigen ligase